MFAVKNSLKPSPIFISLGILERSGDTDILMALGEEGKKITTTVHTQPKATEVPHALTQPQPDLSQEPA